MMVNNICVIKFQVDEVGSKAKLNDLGFYVTLMFLGLHKPTQYTHPLPSARSNVQQIKNVLNLMR